MAKDKGKPVTPAAPSPRGEVPPMAAVHEPRSRKQAVAQKSGLKLDADPDQSARPASRRDKKGVLIYVSPAVSKQLRGLAIEKDTSVQALGIEAINLLLAHYRLKPIA
jgi:hypothetical protein